MCGHIAADAMTRLQSARMQNACLLPKDMHAYPLHGLVIIVPQRLSANERDSGQPKAGLRKHNQEVVLHQIGKWAVDPRVIGFHQV